MEVEPAESTCKDEGAAALSPPLKKSDKMAKSQAFFIPG
jgi:hypothetical protein